jgi:hypothetical protein
VHRLENGNQVTWGLLESLVIGQGSELLVDSLGPIADLIVDNIDALEPFLETRVLLKGRGQFIIHHDDVAVVINGDCL